MDENEPQASEVIDGLYKRLGEDGIRRLIATCLQAGGRARAVQLINDTVGTVRLAASADRGRIGRLLAEGLGRRRAAVLDVLQTLTRDPFEVKADAAARERFDAAVEALNQARAASPPDEASKHEAAQQVASVIRDVLEPDEADRMVQLNAFPDTVEAMLATLAASGRS